MKNCITVSLMVMWLALFCPLPIQAAPITVTTWNLQPNSVAGSNGWSNKIQQSLFQEAAESLKKLHPDVILLQQVADWETCHQLARALRPEVYQVAVCSSFCDSHAKLLGRQVAILSKAKPYLALSQQWQTASGGFAFAALRLGDKNVGIFSVQLGDGAESGMAFQQACDDSARQLVTQIAFLQNWNANRLQTFIVAGDFNTTPDVLPLAHEKTLLRLEHIGFDSAYAGRPLQGQTGATLDYIFTRNTGLAGPPVTTQSPLSEHGAVTVEMDSPAPNTVAALPPAPAMLSNTTSSADGHQTLLWLAGCLAGVAALFVLALIFPRRSTLQPAPVKTRLIIATPKIESPPYVQVETEGTTQTQSQTWRPHPEAGRVATRMPEAVRAGVIADLSRWLKQKVVQRLMSDRAELLATQQTAALKVLAVDERLAKVERHIQRRNQEYEQRIDSLLQALITAREENRELIRAKIALLKAEMEEARFKE